MLKVVSILGLIWISVGAECQSLKELLKPGKVISSDQMFGELKAQEVRNLKRSGDEEISAIWFYSDKSVTILLTERKGNSYTLKHSITEPIRNDGFQVRLSGCAINGKADDYVFALVPIELSGEPIQAIQAWRASMSNLTIVNVSANSVTCPPLGVVEQ